MRKLITFFIAALLGCGLLFAADIVEGTQLYLTPNANWKSADARFAAYFFAGGENAWTDMTPVAGETDMYETVAPAGTWTNVIFCRMNPATTENNWDNKWDQTVNLEYNGANNHFTINEGAWNNADGIWSLYAPSVESAVHLSVPSVVFIDEQITFSATSENITSPVYTYSVKTPGSEEFVPAVSPYTPAATGAYTFKVEAGESTAPETVLASDTKDVVVKDVPAPITIKVKKHANWEPLYFYNWSDGIAGNFVASTLNDEWYSYTFERVENLNIVFVDKNEWNEQNQTVDITNITSSTCYEIIDAISDEGDPDWGKYRVNTADCGPLSSAAGAKETAAIVVKNNTVSVSFDGAARINLYSMSGQLIHSANAVNEYTKQLQNGVYLLRINDKTHKLIVQ